MAKILIVEDEAVLRMTFEHFLDEEGFEVRTAANFDEALRALDESVPDVIVTDIILGGKTGLDLLHQVQENALASMVVMITGDPSVATATEAVRLGAFDYLAKPVTGPALTKVVRLALDRKRLAEERDLYAERSEGYRKELETIFNSVHEGIITVDGNLRVRHLNKAARDIFSLGEQDLSEKHIEEIGAAALKEVQKAVEDTVRGKKGSADIRLEFTAPRGGDRVVVVSTSPVSNGKGNPKGAVLVARDITRLTRLEERAEGEPHWRNMIGKNERMREIYALIEDLRETDSTVLIFGESGTGKELVAAALHHAGTRSGKPFIKVNCAALHEDILESELFGHVRGAFTGAVKDRMGRFEAANGGTIFLDEIGDISPRLQLRLLRVLQEREFERVGDTHPIRVDVRVIAATNCDLTKRIQEGHFRQDLYYRLNVVRIDLPALRDRREDIPALVDHFCRHFNGVFKKEVIGIAPETMDILMQHPWIGNVRELENCLERAFIVCHESFILPRHLPPEFRSGPIAGSFAPTAPAMPGRHWESRDALGRDHLTEVLTQTDWNVAKAARRLGVARNTLYQRMRAYALSRPETRD